jgi:REP element-mobilizing transposase RayT
MIVGHHLIWTVYGYWLPNDPRGSMSQEIRSASIGELGDLHYGRKRMQPAGRVLNEFRERASDVLKHPLLILDEGEVATIAKAFAELIRSANYTCYACAIMPDHVHLLIRKHRDQADRMLERFQEVSRLAILAKSPANRAAEREARRGDNHPVWGGPGWKVYLENIADMERTIKYIEDNPIEIGRPRQHWDFVRAYDGWIPGEVRKVKKNPRNCE